MELRFGRLIVLACMGLAVACTSGTDGGTTGNSELNLTIVNPGGTSGELGFDIDRVDYRITCAGNAPGSYPIPGADTTGTLYNYDDSVDISGAFETVDTRNPPVWQAVMDLPPGNCTITLSVYEDDEIVCVGSQTLAITEDGTTKYDIVLVCSLSIDLPDGMADVDGTFEFITGNLCPKLYVLNAIPSGNTTTPIQVQPAGPFIGQAVTEVQFRAKDPDNTCGNNCDPQSCDFSNPPVCTPYPSNITDPVCNPAAGGNPNDPSCLDGSRAGLVCIAVAVPLSSGTPGGIFYSPLDGTPIGPAIAVNLNADSPVPGIILPGLGGPAGTNAANSPAYPPLPNVNGSLPPLFYACDLTQPGPVLVDLTCSDGDLECNQNKQLVLTCPGNNFCISDPIDCSGSNDCLSDGTCDANCDPLDVCDRCPGQDNPLAAGTACADGGPTDTVCDGAGNCVECLVDADCANLPAPPQDCQLPNTCVANTCVAGGTAPAGTSCSNGVCDGSGIGSTDPPCQFQTNPCNVGGVITVGCSNNVTADVSILPYTLNVDISVAQGGVVSGNPVVGDLSGIAEFSETFLDAAQGAVPGGVTQAGLVDLIASVQVRSGTSGATVPVGAGSTIPDTCVLTGTPCNPANNTGSVPGLNPNTDCVPTGSFNPCLKIVSIPTTTDCGPGGTCDTLGKLGQCTANGFCVTGGLPIALDPVLNAGLGTADPAGNMLVGWYDNPADASAAVGTPAIDGDGTYNMVSISYTGIAGPVGLAVNAGGLAVQLECVMAEDSGGPDGVGVPDDASPTPDANLLSCPIQVP